MNRFSSYWLSFKSWVADKKFALENFVTKVGKEKVILANLFILLLIPITVLVVRRVTNDQAGADTQQATLFMSPSTQNVAPSSSFQLFVNSQQFKVGFVKTVITFNPQLLQLSRDPTPVPQFGNVITLTSAAEANKTGKINLAVALNSLGLQTPPSQTFKVADLFFTATSAQSPSTTLKVMANQSQVVTADAQAMEIATGNATVTFNPPAANQLVSPSPIPSPSPIGTAPQLSLARVMMVNVSTGQDIQQINTNQPFVANLATLPLYTFRFDPTSSQVQSMKFTQTADYRPTPISHVDNTTPYSAVGYGGGTYYPWDVGVGNYTIQATPYSQPNAQGQAGPTLTFTVQVIDQKNGTPNTSPAAVTPSPQAQLQISKVVMVNTVTGQDIQTMDVSQPITISIKSLPKFTFRYETNFPAGSVQHVQTADYRPTPISHIDNTTPYSAVGYGGGTYYPWDVGVGKYQLSITPFSQANGQGTGGQTLNFTVTVVD